MARNFTNLLPRCRFGWIDGIAKEQIGVKMMEVRVREATCGDAQTVRQFIVELANYQNELEKATLKEEELRSQLSQSKPPFKCLIAEIDNQAVGFALYFESYSTWEGRTGVYLEDLYVDPSFRSYGIGKRLIESLCEIALNQGCSRLEWSVQAGNQNAIDFYSAIGALAMPEWIRWRMDERSMINMLSRSNTNVPGSTKIA